MNRLLGYLTKIPPGPVAGVIVIVALWMMSGAQTAAARVPELEGLQVNPAIAKAADDGFFTDVVFQRTGGIAGTVVRQAPDEFEIRDKGTRIKLYVTKGAPQVRVPDVVGLDVEEARRWLDRGNVTVGTITYRNDDDVTPDKVITTVPAPNKLVDVGTKVDIIASA